MTIQKVFEGRREAVASKGKLYRIDGKLYRILGVTQVGPSLTHDGKWSAMLELRDATRAEEIKTEISELEREDDKLFFSADPGNIIAQQSRIRRVEINQRIAALRADLAAQ